MINFLNTLIYTWIGRFILAAIIVLIGAIPLGYDIFPINSVSYNIFLGIFKFGIFCVIILCGIFIGSAIYNSIKKKK